jgi:hypothetical protein
MAYNFNNISLESVDSAGNTLMTALTFTATTIPVLTEYMAIGNRVKLTLSVDASAGDDFTDKCMRINLGLFVNNNDANAFQFGFDSLVFLTTSPTLCSFVVGTDPQAPTRHNFIGTMERNMASTEATIVIEFFVTTDLSNYVLNSFSVSNERRFLSNELNTNFYPLINRTPSVYRVGSNIGVVGQVYDFATFVKSIFNGAGSKFMLIPVRNRWYNSDYNNPSGTLRFIKEIEITCPSQVALSLPSVTDITATSGQGFVQSTDSAFTIVSNQLSLFEDNSVRILMSGLAKTGIVTNPPVTGIKATVIRLDDISNTQDMFLDLQMSDVEIPQLAVAPALLDGMIYTPSDWFEDVPNPDDVEVQFILDGTQLSPNGRYRIIICVYDDANQDYVTSHITPELTATYVEPVVPTITGYMSVYNREFSGNELTVSPHQRVKATIEIDKTSYNAQLTALGIVGAFDGSLFNVNCSLTARPNAFTPTQGYFANTLTPPLNNEILTSNMFKVIDNATTLRLEALFRIEEEYANTSNIFTWTLNFNQPTFTVGQTTLNRIIFEQKLDVTNFENDVFAPNLLAVRFYDADLYPASKVPVLNICNKRYLVAEVEKDPALTGTINLVATIYPANSSGATTSTSIEEEEDWVPFTIQMAQEFSGKLDSVETSFGSDDFASFVINVNQLTLGQQYWVTAIAFQTDPDYCPIGLTNNIKIDTINFTGGWNITVDLGFLITEILAHPDYVGGINKARYRVIDPPTNVLVGTTQTIVGSVLTVLNIRSSTPSVLLQVQVDADFDPGTGPHTVRHELNLVINLPAYGPITTNLDTNSYICIDLG